MKIKTKIIKDQKQTRTTIPAKLVKESGVENGTHVAEWELKNGKLKAEVKKINTKLNKKEVKNEKNV